MVADGYSRKASKSTKAPLQASAQSQTNSNAKKDRMRRQARGALALKSMQNANQRPITAKPSIKSKAYIVRDL